MAVIKFNYGKIYAIPAHTVLFPCGILMGPSAQKHENLLARIDVDVGNGRAPDAFLQKKNRLTNPNTHTRPPHTQSSARLHFWVDSIRPGAFPFMKGWIHAQGIEGVV
jgi:hypothetical protein